MNRPELLLPASSLEVLKIAVMHGADAVYIGGDSFSLRAKAKNFSLLDIKEGVEFAHKYGKKVYVTVNIYAHNNDLERIPAYIQSLNEANVDAIIVSDPGVFRLVRKICPLMEVHISTQSNSTNYETYNFWYDLGVKRIICARELSLDEIKTIREHIPKDMEIEAFVHGAMCISYSGRCLLSNVLTGRDANKGECTHPCRWEYTLLEKDRPGQYFPIEEDEYGSYILNSKDLCMIEHIPEMIECGINSFKIEGRMKNALYVATMARAYKAGIDIAMNSSADYSEASKELLKIVEGCTHRKYYTGFFFGNPGKDGMIYDENSYDNEYIYLGYVEKVKDGYIYLTQKNKFVLGESIEVMKQNGDNVECRVNAIFDDENRPMESAPHASQKLIIDIGYQPEIYDILRKRKE